MIVYPPWHVGHQNEAGDDGSTVHVGEDGVFCDERDGDDVHGDPSLASAHFMALTSHSIVQLSHYGVLPLPPERTDHLIEGGVAAFLRAYRAN
ncbi:TetR/AcrR family transcriptional regulator C-terminal domain-containing protein [Streptomyces sp. NBC_00096]|uniref:TetR/AcrR family transcriptional regulator C-terminal domain-containing protein n=1 Tax=Streptomyces sp. NBC_00096 TaxID=2975650 RepID=UPI00325668BD